MNLGLWTPFPALLHVLHTPLHLVRAGWHSWSGEVAWKQGSPSTVTRPSPLPVCWARLGLPWWVKRVWREAALRLGSCLALTHKVRVREKGGSLSVTGAIWHSFPPWYGPSGQPPCSWCPDCGLAGNWGWHLRAGAQELGHSATLSWHRGLPFCHLMESEEADPFLCPLLEGGSGAWLEDRRCSF